MNFQPRTIGFALLAMLVIAKLLPAPSVQSEEIAPTRWKSYYERTAQRPPRPILIAALQRFTDEGRSVQRAVDAGCGQGIDTLHMLSQGIKVHAFDAEAEGIERLKVRVGGFPQSDQLASHLETEVAMFHQATWGQDVDLVFAGFALPFAEPTQFAAAWPQLVDSLAIGGRFACQLFGDRDDWASIEGRTHHTREQAEALLRDHFEIEVFEEVEEERMGGGKAKHWHYFEIVAKKVRD